MPAKPVAERIVRKRNTYKETAFFVQSRDLRCGRWTDWTCTSPRYQTVTDARKKYHSEIRLPWWPESEVRLVRTVTTWKRIPKMRTPLCWNAGSTLRVLAKKSVQEQAHAR